MVSLFSGFNVIYLIVPLLRMFNQQEVQILLGGVNAPIDFDDLRRNTHYGGLYDDNEPTIVAFWNVSPGFIMSFGVPTLRRCSSISTPSPAVLPNSLTTRFSLTRPSTPSIKSNAWHY